MIAWQNHLLAFKRANGKGYSASYLRKIHSQLSAIFNHAVDFYHLPSNPAQKAGNIAIEEYKEMLFWTKEEYSLVVESVHLVQKINPRFFIFENVAAFMKTGCTAPDGSVKAIGDVIYEELGEKYIIASRILNFKNYGSISAIFLSPKYGRIFVLAILFLVPHVLSRIRSFLSST